MTTRPAPSPDKTGGVFAGTIGFDLYLASLRVSRATLKPAKLPLELLPS